MKINGIIIKKLLRNNEYWKFPKCATEKSSKVEIGVF